MARVIKVLASASVLYILSDGTRQTITKRFEFFVLRLYRS